MKRAASIFLSVLAVFSLVLPTAGAELLTNAADVISLPADRAERHLKVSVTGVVTASDPSLHGRFFLQDATSGVFVDNAQGERPEPGDLVRVSGVSDAGAYAPIITAPQIQKLGRAPLPEAKVVSVERLMSGAEDSQRIEVDGTVRSARLEGVRLILELVSAGYRFSAFVIASNTLDAQALVAAQVRVRGTAAEAHNRSLRHFLRAEVYVPSLEDFQVEHRELADPFELPPSPLNSLAQYRHDVSPNGRIHVRGVVTLQRLGESLFLKDSTGGLQVQSKQPLACLPGQTVEAVGFPGFEEFQPVLQDAVFRVVPGPAVNVQPKPITLQELQEGRHHADYVQLSGRLINRTVRRSRAAAIATGARPAAPESPLSNEVGPGSGSKSPVRGTETTLVLQSSNFLFAAQAQEGPQGNYLASIPLGSLLEVRGVCLNNIDGNGRMKSFEILLGSPQAARILARPSWLTPRRLLVGLAILAAVLVVIGSWTVMVSQKNSTLNYLIREREKAQAELQQAHDLLEQRVRERTAELKFQITARKESELQFKAVLAERTRLAQELHDTVEQTLTGIALQLDTSAKLHERDPSGTQRHLELARNLMAKSQLEVRRSVWDLRCRALEQFDLPGALLASARQMTCGTRIQVELDSKGPAGALPEVVEENLLRIGQEAITNVIKHSEATRVTIKLQYEDQQVVLEISDNGKGFAPETCAGPGEGHFGLLGMAERAKRLNGRLSLSSQLPQGSVVRVEIPLTGKEAGATPPPVNGHAASSSNGHLAEGNRT